MPLTITWTDIALRLALAFLAGVFFGFDRGEHGKPAGLRTIILVCLAAASAMILANLLLVTHGKGSDSFVQIDPMRLPLGVLTGIGFIGAGAIIRRGDLVVGVTTAATIWFVTMIGLAFGAGQFTLGGIGMGAGLFVLLGLRRVEDEIKQERRGRVIVFCDPSHSAPMSEPQLRAIILGCNCKVDSCSVRYAVEGVVRMVRYDIRWHARRDETRPPEFLNRLTRQAGVRSVRWHGL